MHNVFSADDFTDPFWQAAAPSDAAINRNASEWDLERFLREFPSSGSNSASDSTVTVPSQSPPSTKPEICDGDVIEIRQPQLRSHYAQNHAPSMPHSQPHHVPQQLDRAPMGATIDTEEYRAFLKSQLDLACAAVARNQTAVVKPPDFSPLLENQSPAPAANSFHLGSQQPCASAGIGLGNTIAQRQDHGSPTIQPLPVPQKKQEVQTRQTTGGSSGEDSDDDDLEGDTGTNGAPADVKRSRRMLSNRESARRSRRRKQDQLNELESQAGQLRDERTTLLSRLTDVNHKCDEASVDNRVLKANIETLRAKVKMAEEQVKRVTGLNPLLLARSNVPSMGMHHQYTGGTPNHQSFHHPPPNMAPSVPPPHMQQPMHYPRNNVTPVTANSHGVSGMNHNMGGMNSMPFRANEHNRVADVVAPPMQKPVGPGVNPRPVDTSGLGIHGVAKVDKKK